MTHVSPRCLFIRYVKYNLMVSNISHLKTQSAYCCSADTLKHFDSFNFGPQLSAKMNKAAVIFKFDTLIEDNHGV